MSVERLKAIQEWIMRLLLGAITFFLLQIYQDFKDVKEILTQVLIHTQVAVQRDAEHDKGLLDLREEIKDLKAKDVAQDKQILELYKLQ